MQTNKIYQSITNIFILMLLLLFSSTIFSKNISNYKGRVISGNYIQWIYMDIGETKYQNAKGKYIGLWIYSSIYLDSHELFKSQNGEYFVKIFLGEGSDIEQLTRNDSTMGTYSIPIEDFKNKPIYIKYKYTEGFFIFENKVTTQALHINEISKNLSRAIETGKINELEAFIQKYKPSKYSKFYTDKARKNISILKKETSKKKRNKEQKYAIDSGQYDKLLHFYNNNKNYPQSKSVTMKAYEIIKSSNTFKDYVSYVKDFGSNSPNYNNSIEKIYYFVKKKNNISGYKWFIDNYEDSKESKEALLSIYKLAFEEAKDIDTIESYNDFIIAYPYAKDVKQATKLAYDLELAEYTGWFSSDDDNSRALLIKSKRLAREMKKADFKAGYMLVINRINELLQDAFPSEEATLRHLESEEFMDFVDKFDNAMDRINRNLRKISDNTENLSSILRDQSNMMDGYFRESAQEQEMANYHTKQHQFWQRYLKDNE